MVSTNAGEHILIKYILEAVLVSYLPRNGHCVSALAENLHRVIFYHEIPSRFPFRARKAEGLCY